MANSIYLVGLRQGAPNYGGFSNTLEMPQFCFESFEGAKQKYDILNSLGHPRTLLLNRVERGLSGRSLKP